MHFHENSWKLESTAHNWCAYSSACEAVQFRPMRGQYFGSIGHHWHSLCQIFLLSSVFAFRMSSVCAIDNTNWCSGSAEVIILSSRWWIVRFRFLLANYLIERKMMDTTGAYGGGKAGAAFDPQAFIQRPPVIVRAVCWVRFLNFTLYYSH